MLPKERVIAAIQHREGDRVPVGEIGVDWEITERALGHPTFYRARWREWIAEWEGKRDAVVASYGEDIVALAKTFEWDFVVVPLVPARQKEYKIPEMLGKYTWRDESGKVWRYSADSGGHPMLIDAPPLKTEDLVVPERVRIDKSRLEAVSYVIKELGGSHFVFGRAPDGTFPWIETVGLEEFLIRMMIDPEFVDRAIEISLRISQAWIEAMCDLGVDGILIGTDYCDNRGLMMGPRPFRKFILPALGKLCRTVHARGKFFVKHTDGYTWDILDDFVSIGLDGWQGIQPRIGMDLKLLKEKYAGKICLFGGVNCETLVGGTPEEVEAEVHYAVRNAAPGGGLVLTSGNTLLVGTRYENYMRMLSAAHKYGIYPIAP